MHQKVFSFQDIDSLKTEISSYSEELTQRSESDPHMFFQIFSPDMHQDVMAEISKVLTAHFPSVACVGNSTSGNIASCDTHNEIIITANVFDLPTSRFEVFQYDLNQITPNLLAKEILKKAVQNSWVKAIEIYWTINDFSTTELCDGLKDLNPDIQVFGGIVCSPDISCPDSFIFSSADGFCSKGVQFIFYGGPDFHINATKICGWQPIGRNFLVTKASGSRLYELGGVPAYEIYKKYLNIKNDDNFFINALDFPMMYEHNNTTIVRAPAHSLEDGSLAMSSDVEVGEILRLSYGDPQTILRSVRQESSRIFDFEPDVMHIFSCAARKAYWAPYEPTYEIQSLKGICDMTGFFSHGEFIREKEYINQHNITLVIASMREGSKVSVSDLYSPDSASDILGDSIHRSSAHRPQQSPNETISSGRLPLAARMATFIRETSYELEEINSTLQIMNQQLEGLASTDSLTHLKNRLSYNDILKTLPFEDPKRSWVMLMMDVNGLKYTNDTFGHLAGDELIISAAHVIEDVFGNDGYCFRIGGDEFSIIIDATVEKMSMLMNRFRQRIWDNNQRSLYHLSIAVGESRIRDASNNLKSISDWKLDADLNMYRDKTRAHRLAYENPELQNHKELINCMITIEEAKDPYTAHHSDRVSDLSAAIARMLGLTENTIQNIRDAAHLHDIGKVGISDAILSKPAALTDEEFERIKEHPVIGARILMQSNYMHELVQIVLHHHERYDGKGYPDRLAGSEIPIGARIVALADSIDAMTSRRVYRNALSLQACRLEIEHNLGRIYDPAIGKICLEHWEEIEKILLLHPKRLQDI